MTAIIANEKEMLHPSPAYFLCFWERFLKVKEIIPCKDVQRLKDECFENNSPNIACPVLRANRGLLSGCVWTKKTQTIAYSTKSIHCDVIHMYSSVPSFVPWKTRTSN